MTERGWVRRGLRGRGRSGDDGAAALEYVGLLLVLGALVAALVVSFLATPVGPYVQTAICRFLSLGCGDVSATPPGPDGTPVPRDEDFVPPPCMLSEVGEVAATQVKIAFFTVGDDFGFIERTYADGRVTMTAVDGATIGLIRSGSTKVVDLGRLDDETQAGGALEVSGGVDMDYGDTWTFDDADQAEKMRSGLDDYLAQQAALTSAGEGAAGLHLYYWLSDGYKEPPKPATTTFATIGLDAALSGSLGLKEPLGPEPDGTPGYLDPNVGIEAALSGDYDVKVETNHLTGDRSYTYTVTGTGSAGGNLVVGEAGVRGATTGAFKITRNEAGEITGISMVSTREGGLTAGLEGKTPVGAPVSPSGSGGTRETQVTVTEVALKVTTDAQRQVVQDWLSSNNEQLGTPLALTANAMVPSRANPASPFETMLFQQASVARLTYDNVTDTRKFGLDVKAGWELGLSVTLDSWRKDVTEASYLGAPRADGSRPMLEDTSCR